MRRLISIPLLLLLCGCSDLGYYWQNARGHLAVMDQRVEIPDLLADKTIDQHLRERLLLVQEIRDFSVERLALPDNGSYHSYVELGRPYLIKNLFAAEEFSTRLRQWCYPIIGCASYRGYYDEERLREYVEQLVADGLEVYVGKVPAYSTLGWFDDPVLSSFIDWPDFRLAGLLFHELTHQRIYIEDDTTFNESLASAVQQVGTRLWLQSLHRDGELAELSTWMNYRSEVISLIEATRGRLAALYGQDIDDSMKRERKAAIFSEARRDHDAIAAKHGVKGGFHQWFANGLNNAKLGSVSAYNAEVPAFVAILQALDQDFSVFFDYVEALAALDEDARDACLGAWSKSPAAARDACAGAGEIPPTASS
ncbi:MAG: aminopeptidase [Gammaproteobacteria bacterium]|jgi:predicted aminopeptidase